eukprot:3692668-Amphidinium_carterae.1
MDVGPEAQGGCTQLHGGSSTESATSVRLVRRTQALAGGVPASNHPFNHISIQDIEVMSLNFKRL